MNLHRANPYSSVITVGYVRHYSENEKESKKKKKNLAPVIVGISRYLLMVREILQMSWANILPYRKNYCKHLIIRSTEISFAYKPIWIAFKTRNPFNTKRYTWAIASSNGAVGYG